MDKLLRFPNKKIRAQVIKEYMNKYGYKKAVCFSCGNASKELRNVGVDVLDVSPTGDLQALRWFHMGEIHNQFSYHFDATSGHLPMECMHWISKNYKLYLKKLPERVVLPTGSGETLVCLKFAFPKTKIIAAYNLDKATQYDKCAPLNPLVEFLAEKIIFSNDQ